MSYKFEISFDREDDGRWIAEVSGLPGVLAYGHTQEEAARAVQALALRVLADQVEANPPARDLELKLASA
jgi:predicted RNase H-like HicB family nuclease